ncbi:hypothetical protein GCK72_025259 [Caenorhabditis remanei]|uniref:F-box domain-containing protein n=1 Tax=Caenorhabditis remanei TaxID=31234 RepID=A0A6A5G293_CAERE|nr:hypothetical protein GCK72_025259 [Caenorhabditis remanei]KAF1748792.1 hypothetical protein GCK72_025259 [Caenorhabditis remanei]
MKKEFQLCELPNKVITNVLATMHFITTMSIAQCSTKFYNLVNSLNLKAEVSIEDSYFISVFTDHFELNLILQDIAPDTTLVGSVLASHEFQSEYIALNTMMVGSVWARDGYRSEYDVVWKKTNTRVIDWIRFILDLINEKVPFLLEIGDGEYEPE